MHKIDIKIYFFYMYISVNISQAYYFHVRFLLTMKRPNRFHVSEPKNLSLHVYCK